MTGPGIDIEWVRGLNDDLLREAARLTRMLAALGGTGPALEPAPRRPSVWVHHLGQGNDRLGGLLSEGQAVCHPFVIGELACGNLKNRAEILLLSAGSPARRRRPMTKCSG